MAPEAADIPPERIYVDKKSGATTNRPGLQAAMSFARHGDVIVIHTLDRLGRTVRDTPNLIHDLAERGVGIRTLADPITVDSANPDDPMAQLAVVLLALFAQMERTYSLERAAGACAAATAKGRRIGRPTVVDPDKLACAAHLRDTGSTIAEIVTKTWSQNLRVCHCATCRSWSSIVGSHGEDDAAAAGRRPALGADRPPDPVPTSAARSGWAAPDR